MVRNRNTVKLTESKLRNLITETVKECLMETEWRKNPLDNVKMLGGRNKLTNQDLLIKTRSLLAKLPGKEIEFRKPFTVFNIKNGEDFEVHGLSTKRHTVYIDGTVRSIDFIDLNYDDKVKVYKRLTERLRGQI